jgi:hypothetical protein
MSPIVCVGFVPVATALFLSVPQALIYRTPTLHAHVFGYKWASILGMSRAPNESEVDVDVLGANIYGISTMLHCYTICQRAMVFRFKNSTFGRYSRP